MPLARTFLSSLIRSLSPGLAAVLSLTTAFAGRPQLNEAPPAPAITRTRAAQTFAPAAASAPSGFVIDPSSRERARVFFRTVYAASENVPSGWTGSVAGGNAGTTSASFKDAVQRRVNYFRAMAGIPAGVTFDATYNSKDQQAALMMSANDSLSHAPPSSWTDYTAGGAEAAGHSDLFLGYYGPQAITGYIEDFGSPNASAGHRRWILYPQTKTMGTGDIPPDGSYESANALWIATPDFGTTRPAVRNNFVAWPPPGFVPYPLVFPRWSLSYPGADFSRATVTMKRGGANVPVAIQSRGTGAGEDSIVWAWDNLDATSELPPGAPPASDTPVQVAVNNVVIGGSAQNFSYTVTLFDPQKAGADTVLAVASGPAQPVVSASNSYACNAVPNATGYQFRTAPLSTLTAIEGAENGTASVTVDAPAGTAIISSAYHASGTHSFHFTTPDFDHQSITLTRTVLAASSTQLNFKTRFGYATPQQVAHAQISTDDGHSWDTLFTAAGTSSPAASFTSQTISLAAYANRTVSVRFVFAYEGDGAAYTQTADNFGWYLDDVSFTHAQELTGAALSSVSASTSHSFTPPVAGSYAVQARAEFFGGYLFEWGPVLAVAAADRGEPPSLLAKAAGRYRGLALTSPAAHASCGLVTIAIAANGALSGQVVIGGARLAFRGVFDSGGIAHFGAGTEATLSRTGQPPLLLRLHLPTGSDTPARVLGDVREATGFTAAIDAPRAIFTAAKNPPAPLLNPPAAWPSRYNADLTLSAATPVASLNGRGWIAGAIGKDGGTRFGATLADGAHWSSAQPLAADGTAPIFALLYGGKGSVFGVVQVAGSPVTLASTLNWFRPANLPGVRFTTGWPAGVKLVLDGAAWTPFKLAVTWPLPGLAATGGSAHIWANGGSLSPSLDWAATVALQTGRVTISPTASGAMATFVCTAGTGIFTGNFRPSSKVAPLYFSGVLVPGANRARGFFLTPSGSGALSLLPK